MKCPNVQKHEAAAAESLVLHRFDARVSCVALRSVQAHRRSRLLCRALRRRSQLVSDRPLTSKGFLVVNPDYEHLKKA